MTDWIEKDEITTPQLDQNGPLQTPSNSDNGISDQEAALQSFLKDSDNRDILLPLAVAFYLSIGLPQKDIAPMLCRSESVISRAASDAKKRGWLKIIHDISGIPPRYLHVLPVCLSVPDLRKRLLRKFDQIGNCTVVPGPKFFKQIMDSSDKVTQNNEEQEEKYLYELLIKAAAERLVAIISACPDQNLVVSWGYTINAVIKNTYFAERKRQTSEGGSSLDPLRIFPIMGNFSINPGPDSSKDLEEDEARKAFEIFIRYSANGNARILSERCGQKLPPRPLLTVAMVDGTPEEVNLCKPMFLADRTLMELYGKFWEPDDFSGTIWKTDTLITSIGTSAHPQDFVYRALGYDVRSAGKDFAGDICGILFDKKGNRVPFDRGQLIGPRLRHIQQIAENHRMLFHEKKKPKGAGVVVVAAGKEKVSPIRLLAERGYINELITTERTAEMLLGIQSSS